MGKSKYDFINELEAGMGGSDGPLPVVDVGNITPNAPPIEEVRSSVATTQPIEQTPEELSLKLENAANLLLSQLDPAIREFAYEVADLVVKVPRWILVCGVILKQYESGQLSAPTIDPSWSANLIHEEQLKCKWCGSDFTPKRHGQLFCVNKCGTAWVRSEREQGRLKSDAQRREDELYGRVNA